ncbi:pentatricopeptide repeat-containing protein At2g33680-like [Cryptomeria japonica]|uniref:pentatricopeptide repeat-containing protein At2g33680-like n=1 Tax=Cryptomeria japonica TaxID=3369 RepID=UPI0027DA81E4|nr:pentatricopeptide repeat-containing protein At2g33680-like [Cryptomeria japonica]
MGALEEGMETHKSIIKSGFLSDVVIANTLTEMYAKCRSIHKSRQLFHNMPQDVVSCSTTIAGYAQNGFVLEALETFKQIQLADVNPNSTTFASILPVCAKNGDLEQDVVLVSSLVDMYTKCGSLEKASELFDKMSRQDVVSWIAIISGYAQNGLVEEALETFKKMQLAGIKPNCTTFFSVFQNGSFGTDVCNWFSTNVFYPTDGIINFVGVVGTIAGSIGVIGAVGATDATDGIIGVVDVTDGFDDTDGIINFVGVVGVVGVANIIKDGLLGVAD